MDVQTLIKLIPLFPLLGFIFCGLIGKRVPRSVVGAVATSTVAISFACAVAVFLRLVGLPAEERSILAPVYNWMTIPGLVGDRPLSLDVAFLVDPLSITMTLIITGIGALIHFYAMGYMAHDARYSRFFSFLNLFVAFMLVLVLGHSFPVMFVGWEGVGLCSYLLIGFWFEDMANAAAGTKAFIVNRIGDFGFLVAMFWIFLVTGSLTFSNVFANVELFTGAALLGITLLLFLGATGKSAQIPLYIWLPDAMAGPTPVSALIHAATMVTAGVYMVARCHALFTATPQTQLVVAGIGALTALMAATIALVQFDLKKVLAYSTVSQLGYMFIGVGTGAYASGIFHLFTHAFFKACLFLGAGAVMHGLANQIDMRYMGNLKRYMKHTRWTYLIAVIAIAGIFPLAGFWSKDEILAAAFDRGGPFMVIYAIGLITAFMTAFYMFRSYYLTFEGEERIDWNHVKQAAVHDAHGAHGHSQGTDSEGRHHASVQAVSESEKGHLIHELPGMSIVLWVLAIGSIVVGALFGVSALAHGVLENLSFEGWLHPALSAWWTHGAAGAAHEAGTEAHGGAVSHQVLALISLAVAVLGWLAAWAQHRKRALDTAGLPVPVYNVFWSKYWVDEAYQAVFVNGGRRLSVWLWQVFDEKVVDGLVNGAGTASTAIGGVLRRWNTGFVRTYAFSILVGVVIIVGYMIYHVAAVSSAPATAVSNVLMKGGL